MSHWFACEIEEVVRPRGAMAPSVRRVDRGFARGDAYGSRGFSVEASTEAFDETLGRLAAMLALPATPDLSAVPPSIAARALSRVSVTSTGEEPHREGVRVVTLTANGMSVIATAETLAGDVALLERLAGREPVERIDPDALPIAWQNGAAAVLFHEAVGHPAERGLFAGTIPGWLTVEDDPSAYTLVRMTHDDTGAPVARRVLTSGDRPDAFRRWSHRDVPARRMTNLVARGDAAGRLETLPDTRIDALLVAEGWWDPPTDTLGVRVVAADLVDGRHRVAVEPFVYTARREELFPLLRGWFGEVTRHPGVICGDEGVPLPVGSASAGFLTEAR